MRLSHLLIMATLLVATVHVFAGSVPARRPANEIQLSLLPENRSGLSAQLPTTDAREMPVTQKVEAMEATPAARQPERLQAGLRKKAAQTTAQAPMAPADRLKVARKHESGEKSQVSALLLNLFAGSLGIHRFYLGYKTIGIVQLVLTVTLIFSIVTMVWSLVDLVRIIWGSLKPKGGEYSRKF